jgi:thymidine phosphorylase
MSKKIAEGTSSLVLDVKVGSGAFMRDIDDARELAQTMVALGAEHGVRTSALLTSMDVPLGQAVGNAIEVEEAVATLRGHGPDDLTEVTLALAAEMLQLAGVDADPAAALADGRALRKFQEMIEVQGGDLTAPLPHASFSQTVAAPASGWLDRLDARAVGVAAWLLGAGRARKEDPVDPAAGVFCLAKPGDQVKQGQPVLELRGNDLDRLSGAQRLLKEALEIGAEPPTPRPLILERIGPAQRS